MQGQSSARSWDVREIAALKHLDQCGDVHHCGRPDPETLQITRVVAPGEVDGITTRLLDTSDELALGPALDGDPMGPSGSVLSP